MYRDTYIKNLKSKLGSEVLVAGWVHEVRFLGKIAFIKLRDMTGIVQVIGKKDQMDSSEFQKMDRNKEDVISVRGKVVENPKSKDGFELVAEKLTVLSEVRKKLPVDPTGHVESELDTRLNYRFIDLRNPKVSNIFRIKSKIVQEFRKFLVSKEFLEIHPTSIVAAATEGGTEVFPVQYFEQQAYLAQSPQLYKQMAVIGGLDRVFMTMPVFRAEKHNTTTHLNEVIQMDVEIGFADDKDAMDILSETAKHIINSALESEEAKGMELGEPIRTVKKYTYSEIIDLLNENNFSIEWGDDFSKEAEKKIYSILNERLFLIHDWPTAIRAFYSMPKENEPEICKAYDLMFDGLEISSGAQRIHIPELLTEQIQKRGMDPKNFEFYLEAFRYGAPPHAGWSIGLERTTMQLTKQKNIRECMLFPRDRTRVTP